MSTNSCFICLENTKNKVCNTCNCFAHPKCWKEYILNDTRISVNFSDLEDNKDSNKYDKDEKYEYTESLSCPICRKDLTTFSRLTRSKTLEFRFFKFSIDLLYHVSKINDLDNLTIEDEERLYDLLNIISENKNLISIEPLYNSTIHQLLKKLHEKNYKMANIYHYKIFNEQII